VFTAAMNIAKDAAEGRLSPAGLEQQAVAELRELVGEVVVPAIRSGRSRWTLPARCSPWMAFPSTSCPSTWPWLASVPVSHQNRPSYPFPHPRPCRPRAGRSASKSPRLKANSTAPSPSRNLSRKSLRSRSHASSQWCSPIHRLHASSAPKRLTSASVQARRSLRAVSVGLPASGRRSCARLCEPGPGRRRSRRWRESGNGISSALGLNFPACDGIPHSPTAYLLQGPRARSERPFPQVAAAELTLR
jgi:hypothetical protein